jgi:hypothetical protein
MGDSEMLDSTGTGRIHYEDVLGAIGYFIDQNNLSEICMVELREGILLRGMSKTAHPGGYQTMMESYLFTNEDLDRIVNEAYARRQAEEQQKMQQQLQQMQQQQDQRKGFFGR